MPEVKIPHSLDAYTWTPLTEEPPVTDAVKGVLSKCWELRGV